MANPFRIMEAGESAEPTTPRILSGSPIAPSSFRELAEFAIKLEARCHSISDKLEEKKRLIDSLRENIKDINVELDSANESRRSLEENCQNLTSKLSDSESKRRKARDINIALHSKLKSLETSSQKLKNGLKENIDLNERLRKEVQHQKEENSRIQLSYSALLRDHEEMKEQLSELKCRAQKVEEELQRKNLKTDRDSIDSHPISTLSNESAAKKVKSCPTKSAQPIQADPKQEAAKSQDKSLSDSI